MWYDRGQLGAGLKQAVCGRWRWRQWLFLFLLLINLQSLHSWPSPILWGVCLHPAPLPSQKMASDDPKLLTLVMGSEMGHGPG